VADQRDKSPLFVDRSSSAPTTVILILMIALVAVGAYVLIDNLAYRDTQDPAPINAASN